MPSQVASVRIEVTGLNRLRRAMKVLGEKDAPFLRDAIETISRRAAHETAARAPGSMAQTVAFVGLRGGGAQVKGLVRVSHPGAKAMEFGRHKYYDHYKGRAVRTGQKVMRRGQKEKPFVGVVNQDAAIGAIAPVARQLIEQAFEAEWDRLANLPDTADVAAAA